MCNENGPFLALMPQMKAAVNANLRSTPACLRHRHAAFLMEAKLDAALSGTLECYQENEKTG